MKYIIDLDGTLLDSEKANLDSVEFISKLQRDRLEFLIMTNSIKSPQKIHSRLKNVGIDVALDQIMNPIIAMNTYLEEHGFKSAYAVGSQEEIDQLNIDINDTHPDIVLLLDFEKDDISYTTLQKVFTYIEKKIPVITASRSLYYLKSGKKTVDTGAFVALLETISGIDIEVIGKPAGSYFTAGVQKLRAKPEEVIVIGDDWRTDVLGAAKIGCHSILIKSGKYKIGDESNCKENRSVDKLMDIFL